MAPEACGTLPLEKYGGVLPRHPIITALGVKDPYCGYSCDLFAVSL